MGNGIYHGECNRTLCKRIGSDFIQKQDLMLTQPSIPSLTFSRQTEYDPVKKGFLSCGVFVDLTKPLILLTTTYYSLNFYGLLGIVNQGFSVLFI